MPDIFLKDHRLKLIEYGSNQQGLEIIDDVKAKVAGFIQDILSK